MSLPSTTRNDESPALKSQAEPSSIMGQETNIELINALEKQVEAGEGNIIELKRSRNSLLNISMRVPPEILGYIFSQSQTPIWQGGLGPRSDSLYPNPYNFLLVCHHWFEVASRTPQLWSFWGHTLQEWRARYRHASATAIDLAYYGHESGPIDSLDSALEDALTCRASQDGIRRVHLLSLHGSLLLSNIIYFLTPDGEGVQCRSIESIDLQHFWDDILDVSNFFARTHLPKLRSLVLGGDLKMPPWDRLAPQTTLLETLFLKISKRSQTQPPTMTQLLSILVLNPGIKYLSLSNSAIPRDGGGGSTSRVRLRHLKELRLEGELHGVLGLLDRLELPDTLDVLELVAVGSVVGEVLQVPPQLRGYLRRACGFQGELQAVLGFSTEELTISITTRSGLRRVRLSAKLTGASQDCLSRLCSDLLRSIPQERVRYSWEPLFHPPTEGEVITDSRSGLNGMAQLPGGLVGERIFVPLHSVEP